MINNWMFIVLILFWIIAFFFNSKNALKIFFINVLIALVYSIIVINLLGNNGKESILSLSFIVLILFLHSILLIIYRVKLFFNKKS
jgi:hypothetical protein